MRILILTQFFQPEPMFKGLPFARALQERGHSVEVLTGFPNYPGGKIYPGYRVRAWRRENIGGVKVTRLPLYPSHDHSSIGRMANYLSFGLSSAAMGPLAVQAPDVVYVYNLVTLALAWRLLRAWHRCAIVLDVQDLWPESVGSSGMLNNRLMQSVLARWCRSAYQSADRLTVLSPGLKRWLEASGVPGHKIEVIYNWCDEQPTLNPATGTTALGREANFEGRFNVLFAGTMGKVQALDAVIAAAKLLRTEIPEVLISFVGGGVDVDRLKTLASGLPNVQFLSKRPYAEAMALIGLADVLLVHLKDDPLFSVTIPSKTQAYLYSGKPILMGVRGDAAALVDEARAGIGFEPENARSLVHAVRAIYRLSREEREKMGANGRRFYQDKLAFAHGVRSFERVFSEATRGPQ